MASTPFQDLMPDNHCFGCGPGNVEGLRIKSVWDGERSICIFRPRPEHCAGPTNFLNGGIIATLIDCHSVCTATAHAYRSEEREIGSAPAIWCVTASMRIEYLEPVPVDQAVHLSARIVASEGKKTRLECGLSSGGRECAHGEVLAIRVPGRWRQPVGGYHRGASG